MPRIDTWGPGRVPLEAEVDGLSWEAPAQLGKAHDLVACFTPRLPEVRLTPLAQELGFVPLTESPLARPAGLELLWRDGRFALLAHGQWLWTGRPGTQGRAPVSPECSDALVLVIDRPSEPGSRFPRVAPGLIWAGLVPVRITGAAA